VKESEADSLRRSAARRRAKGSGWRARLFAQPPLEGGSRRWVWGVAGVALLLLVAFVSGVRVGQEFARPPAKKDAPLVLQDKAGQKIPIRIAEPVKGAAREADGQAPVAEAGEKAKPKEPAESRAKEAPHPQEREAAGAVKPAGASVPPSKTAPKVKYTLQVAALNSADEARELVAKLKSRGYDAYSVTGTAAAKGALHRVRIGSFPSLQEARQFAVEFEKKEKIKTIITNP
jgi:cell division septation protein DedD